MASIAGGSIEIEDGIDDAAVSVLDLILVHKKIIRPATPLRDKTESRPYEQNPGPGQEVGSAAPQKTGPSSIPSR